VTASRASDPAGGRVGPGRASDPRADGSEARLDATSHPYLADHAVGGRHGGPQPLAAGGGRLGRWAGVEERQLADGEREVLRQPVVDVGRDAHPLTTSQWDAGGSNGFGISQPAGSLNTSGWPPAIANVHAAGSKSICSRALRSPSRGRAV